MKNITILGVMMLLFASLFSCSKDLKNKESKEFGGSNSKLLTDIVSANDSLRLNLGTTKGLARFIAVASADYSGAETGGLLGAKIGAKVGVFCGNPITGCVTGAGVGALLGGGIASWATYETTKAGATSTIDFNKYAALCETALQNKDNIEEAVIIKEHVVGDKVNKQLNIDDRILTKTTLNADALNIGKLHNVVLGVLNGDIFLNGEKCDSLEEGKLVHEIIMDKDMKMLYDTTLSIVASGRFFNDSSIPNSVMKLFNQILAECGNDCSDISFIINKYENLIRNSSELTQEEKTNLELAFATALYSYNYWSNQK